MTQSRTATVFLPQDGDVLIGAPVPPDGAVQAVARQDANQDRIPPWSRRRISAASGHRRPGLLRLTAPTAIVTGTLTPAHAPANFSPQSIGTGDIRREPRVSYKACTQSHS